jgi:hypothetical protein
MQARHPQPPEARRQRHSRLFRRRSSKPRRLHEPAQRSWHLHHVRPSRAASCRLASEYLFLASTCPCLSMVLLVSSAFLTLLCISDAYLQAAPLPLGPQIF